MWDLVELFKQRGWLMKSVPRFLWESFRICLKIALEEIVALLPRMMLRRQLSTVGFAGHWHELSVSVKCAEDAAVVTRRHRRRGCPNTVEKGAARAQRLVQVGEFSAGRHALE